jgi:hypothetical protein
MDYIWPSAGRRLLVQDGEVSHGKVAHMMDQYSASWSTTLDYQSLETCYSASGQLRQPSFIDTCHDSDLVTRYSLVPGP